MRVDGGRDGIALTCKPLLNVAIVLRFNGDTLLSVSVLFLWQVDLCFSLLSNSVPSFKTLWILFLELGFASSHGFSFLISVITIMGHWDTLFLLISRLWASNVDWTIIR